MSLLPLESDPAVIVLIGVMAVVVVDVGRECSCGPPEEDKGRALVDTFISLPDSVTGGETYEDTCIGFEETWLVRSESESGTSQGEPWEDSGESGSGVKVPTRGSGALLGADRTEDEALSSKWLKLSSESTLTNAGNGSFSCICCWSMTIEESFC